MKQHTVIGDRLCGELRSLRRVRPIVRHHHERQDGSGYPDGLQGEAVPLLAQIMGVVDVFDALTTPRPYKKALSVERATQILLEEVGRGWRRRSLVETFIDLHPAPGLALSGTADLVQSTEQSRLATSAPGSEHSGGPAPDVE
jgi:putative two-component system response regulator